MNHPLSGKWLTAFYMTASFVRPPTGRRRFYYTAFQHTLQAAPAKAQALGLDILAGDCYNTNKEGTADRRLAQFKLLFGTVTATPTRSGYFFVSLSIAAIRASNMITRDKISKSLISLPSFPIDSLAGFYVIRGSRPSGEGQPSTVMAVPLACGSKETE